MPASPDPDLALRAAQAVADLYSDATARMLEIVARRVAAGIDQPGWAERKLAETTRLRNEAQAVVDRLTREGPDAVTEAVTAGYQVGAAQGSADLGLVGEFGRTSTEAVKSLANETVGLLQATHGPILRSALDAYRSVIAEAVGATVTGTASRRQIAQVALDRFAVRGLTGFTDRAGRRWQLDSYAEMATRTAVGRAQVAGTLDRFQAAGRDLVIVSNHAQECPLCRPWEGKVLSISGRTPKGTRLDDGKVVAGTVAEARGDGLLHANCRHALTAYIVGLTKAPKGTADPDGDAARQRQRELERGIRMWKRRAAAAVDPAARRRAEAKVKEWRAALDQHVERHDLKRLRYREQIGSGKARGRPAPKPEPPKPPIEPYPGGLKLKQAQEWMAKRWGVDEDGKRRAILFDGLGNESADEMAGTMHDLMSRFPETAKRVRVFGGSAPVTKAINASPGVRIRNISPRAYADAARRVGSIRVSGGKFRKRAEILAHLARDEAAGFHPPETGSLAGVVRHEFGHHLFWTAQDRANAAGKGTQLGVELEEAMEQAVGLKRTEGGYFGQRYQAIRQHVSRYATTNNDELMAEAFAYVTSSPNPSALAKSLVSVLLRYAEG